MVRKMKKYHYRVSKNNSYSVLTFVVIVGITYLISQVNTPTKNNEPLINEVLDTKEYHIDSIPSYHGQEYVVINNNVPYFDSDDLKVDSLEKYSSLDALGRCGVAIAKVGQETMPTEPRGSISGIKPSGWHLVKYDNVDGKYLYNRCHLIGYQLTGENANEKNLITCTRKMNTEGMLPFEDAIATYVKETNHHVLYRVIPIYDGDNLLANGVLMEAQSIEDDIIKFNIYVYNVQDGIYIDYQTGESRLESEVNNG